MNELLLYAVIFCYIVCQCSGTVYSCAHIRYNVPQSVFYSCKIDDNDSILYINSNTNKNNTNTNKYDKH